jgi:hypothetical protein
MKLIPNNIQKAMQIRSQVLNSLQEVAKQESTRLDCARLGQEIHLAPTSRGIHLSSGSGVAKKLLAAEIRLDGPGAVESGKALVETGSGRDARRESYSLETKEMSYGIGVLLGRKRPVEQYSVEQDLGGSSWRTTATFDRTGKVLFLESYDCTVQ